MTCKHCNKAIEGRVDKVFCSVLCRKKEWRGTASGTLSPIAVPNGTTSGTAIGTDSGTGVTVATSKKTCTHKGECLSKEDWEDIFKNMSANYYSKACPRSYEIVSKPLANE